jgi:AbiV family abortive infection protein
MARVTTILSKLHRMAIAAFDNAVRLHEDAVLLYEAGRIPSSLHTSVLSIEEIGKYLLNEEILFQAAGGSEYTEQDLDMLLRQTFSHVAKHRWFARHAEQFFVSQTIVRILRSGELETIKQRATYVGFPRKQKGPNFDKRLGTPFRASRKRAAEFITAVNDFLIVMAIGTRKGVYAFDITAVDDRLAQREFEEHLVALWPIMRPSTRRKVEQIRKLEDEER